VETLQVWYKVHIIVIHFSPKLEVLANCSYTAQHKVLWNSFNCCWVVLCRQWEERERDRQTDRHSKANRHCFLWTCWRHTQFIFDTLVTMVSIL